MASELFRMMKEVDNSYLRRKEESKKVWEGFEQEVSALTCLVSQEFREAVDRAQLHFMDYGDSGKRQKRIVRIDSFQTTYDPERLKFSINIGDWRVITPKRDFRGGIYYCAYLCLEQLQSWDKRYSPEIARFVKEFNVHGINFNCNCGSDHK